MGEKDQPTASATDNKDRSSILKVLQRQFSHWINIFDNAAPHPVSNRFIHFTLIHKNTPICSGWRTRLQKQHVLSATSPHYGTIGLGITLI